MGGKESPKPKISNTILNSLLESREYELKLDNDIYLLKMELYSNDLITLNIRQINNLSFYYYIEYNYDKLLILLLLTNEYYNNISKIYKFCDKVISENKIKLVKNKEKMTLTLKNIIDSQEMECKLVLNKMEITNEERLKIIKDKNK